MKDLEDKLKLVADHALDYNVPVGIGVSLSGKFRVTYSLGYNSIRFYSSLEEAIKEIMEYKLPKKLEI